jgi:hypothetical protein
MADEDPERDVEGAYIWITQAVKLIPRPFEGNPNQLREFIEGAETAIEVTSPEKRELVLKFIVAKIQVMLRIRYWLEWVETLGHKLKGF